MLSTRFRRASVLVALTAVGVIGGAGSAAAHVTVAPTEAIRGGYTTLTFRVPNEEPAAGTVKVEISIPAATPIASVRYMAVPGWTAKAVTSKLSAPVTSGSTTLTEAVSSVTFTANSPNRIAPGEFAEFLLAVGPLPEVDSISFPTVQTYDDGTVVEWKDPAAPGGAEPEHPAPTVDLTAGSSDQNDIGSSAAVPASGPSVTADPQSAASVAKSDTAARILGVVGIVVAALALLVGALGLRRRGRSR